MRAIDHDHKGHARGEPFGVAVLAHDERAIRRRLITLTGGEEVLVDLPRTVALETGDVLVLENGRIVEIVAAAENLYEITGRDTLHIMELCWHIGNRHLPCQIEGEAHGPKRILIGRDHVIRDMLEGLGATVREIVEPFSPVRGAYSGGEGHHHHHHHHD
ncbi:urease accessory protein UreE [Pelagibacterium xiamenense]|uniref:urease accessory protein UreE n=1 Tax=Pelagibacterium xiamenense TaxID=2901140 RepID=UPI001E3D51E3|nr:urease accessory protein UreE [Pelagibacterium xiamenense]MCD7058709.1 urease accessory protein UreE [Pelagibacterium xiamenense]